LGKRKLNLESSPLALDPGTEDQVDGVAPLFGVQ